MDLGETMIAAGIGCRKGTSVEAVLAALAQALTEAGYGNRQPDLLATGVIKANEPAISQAAHELGIALVIVDQTAIEAAAPRTLTTSEVSLAYAGTPSLCEAAALAAAGETAQLAAPRIVRDGVTCAIAHTNTELRNIP